MREIPLGRSQGRNAIVDDEDYEYVIGFTWHFEAPRGNSYALNLIRVGGGRRRRTFMHRMILERKLGRTLLKTEYVDHVNGDGLDNRRENLRLATLAQNKWNVGLTNRNTTGYKGVRLDKSGGGWMATIGSEREAFYLGTFDTVEEAAIAYNHASRNLHGEFARFNDVPNWESIFPVRRKRPEAKIKSALQGVYKAHKRWAAKISINGKYKHLGCFDTPEDASAAYRAAFEELHKC